MDGDYKKLNTNLKHVIQYYKERRYQTIKYDNFIKKYKELCKGNFMENEFNLLQKIEGVQIDNRSKLITIKTKRQLFSSLGNNNGIVKEAKNQIMKKENILKNQFCNGMSVDHISTDRPSNNSKILNKEQIPKEKCKTTIVLIDNEKLFNPRINHSQCISKQYCNICQIKFRTPFEYNNHESNLTHILREKYRTDRQFFLKQKSNIEVKCHNSNIKEEFLIHKVEEIFIFKIKNLVQTRFKFNIIEMVPNKKVTITNINQSNLLEGSQTIQFNVIVTCEHPALLLFPFVIISSREGDESNVNYDIKLKECVFRVCNEISTKIVSIPAYKPAKNVYLSESEEPIIGNAPDLDFVQSALVSKRPLKSYELKDSLIKLLNGNLNEGSIKCMTPAMLKEFQQIKRITKNINPPKNCVNINNYSDLFHLLLFMEEYQLTKEISKYNKYDQVLTLRSKLFELEVDNLLEQRPSILRGDRVIVTPNGLGNKLGRFEGVIHDVQQNIVKLAFDNYFYVHYNETTNMKYSVEFCLKRGTFRKEHRAVDLVVNHKVQQFFFPTEKMLPALQEKQSSLQFFNPLIERNKEQKEAVINIVSGTAYPAPFLLFGPPGTGKTVTLTESIKQIWKLKPLSRILVCTPSNSAANVITERLIDDINSPNEIIRLFAPSQDWDLVPTKIQQYTNYSELYQEMCFASMKKLKNYRIIIATLMTASRLAAAGFPEGHFTHLFIDECGQATETEALVSITGTLTSEKRQNKLHGHIILAGDPQQLGPIINSNLAKYFGFGISLLERLMTNIALYQRNSETNQYNNRVLTKLLKNFRSNKHILHLSNEKFYGGELLACASKRETDAALNWPHLLEKQFPLIFHCSYSQEKREANSPSYFNQGELDIVMYYIKLIVNKQLNPSSSRTMNQNDIGIVTPYKMQVKKLTRLCEQKGYRDIVIGSVEQFQGQEKTVIIVSTVRSQQNIKDCSMDGRRLLGFLTDPKRFNVTMTRAKSLLIIVGNPNVLKHDENWRDLINYCENNGALYNQLNYVPIN